MNNRKAQFGALVGIALAIIIFAIVIGVGVVVLSKFGDTVVSCSNIGQGTSYWNNTNELCTNYNGCSSDATWNGSKCSNATTIFSNETIILNDTLRYPATISTLTGVVLTNVIVTNATGGETITNTNYTIVAGGFKTAANAIYNQSSINVSATYGYDSSVYTIAGSGVPYASTSYLTTQLGTGGLAGWVPAIIALMVGLLFIGYLISKRRSY